MIEIIAAIVGGLLGGFLPTYFFLYKPVKDRDAKKETAKINYSLSPCDFEEKIKQAKDCIFFSGVVLSHLGSHQLRDCLTDIDPRIKISIFAVDLDDDVHFNTVCRLYGDGEIISSMSKSCKNWMNEIKNRHENSFIKRTNAFTPISYFAVDYNDDKESSFIQAKHYLHRKEPGAKVFYCTVRPGHELYKYYREQIMLIEEKNGKIGFVFDDVPSEMQEKAQPDSPRTRSNQHEI